MRSFNDSTCRFQLTPVAISQSPGWRGRVCRCLILMGVFLGQVGLPNLTLCRPSTACQHPDAAPGTRCQCPPSLRRVGRCCCAMKSTTPTAGCRLACSPKPQRSCCRKNSSPVAASQPAAKHDNSLEFRNDCPCGQGSDVPAYRCTDPRALPPRIELSPESVLLLADPVRNDSPCGQRLPPPLPPPRPPVS